MNQLEPSNHDPEFLQLRKLTLIGVLTAVCVVSRIIKIPLPNVQPVTDILMITTLFLGISYGLPLAILTMIVSNLILGFGIWTIPQIFAYFMVILTIFLLQKVLPLKKYFSLQFLLSGLLGLEYGFFVSLGMAIWGGLAAFWAYYLNGVLFDIYHALGNFCFYPLLYPPLRLLIAKYSANQGVKN